MISDSSREFAHERFVDLQPMTNRDGIAAHRRFLVGSNAASNVATRSCNSATSSTKRATASDVSLNINGTSRRFAASTCSVVGVIVVSSHGVPDACITPENCRYTKLR